MNTRMTGGSVRDHCLAMMSHISRAEVMGATLEEEMCNNPNFGYVCKLTKEFPLWTLSKLVPSC